MGLTGFNLRRRLLAQQVATEETKSAQFGEGALGSGKHEMLVSDGTQDRVAVGDLSGRIWRGQPLPPGTFGVWAPDGYIAVSNSAFKQITDTIGTSTTQRFDYKEQVLEAAAESDDAGAEIPKRRRKKED